MPDILTLVGGQATAGGFPLVTFVSQDAQTSVSCEMPAPILVLPPKPKITTIDRPGATGLTNWVGQDPYEMRVPVRLDGYPGASVEAEIAALESLAEVQPGQDEPPAVTLIGSIPLPHPNLQWRVSSFDDPTGLLFLPGGTRRCRYETTVNLVQRVTDAYLTRTLHQTSKSNGLKVRTWTVKAGEDDLFTVARHAYHDPSRASDIAVANSLHLGVKLKVGQKLKLPG